MNTLKPMTYATSQARAVPAAYKEGWVDFYLDSPVCMYRPKSHYNREWHRGYNDAFFYNKETHVQSIPQEYLRQV